MKCPFCGNEETKVIDKRVSEEKMNRRRRECLKCGKRFTTYEKIENLITKVKKRNGKVVNFSQEKITEAIWKAAQSVGGTDREIAESLASKVLETLEEKFGGVTLPTVEQVQDIVEKVLVENGHYKTAKAYILYREQHKKIRETKDTFVEVDKTIKAYLDKLDWRVKENSNEQYSFSGLLLYAAGRVMSNYNLNEVYSSAISDAHKKGYLHIHDLSHGVIGYCCGHSLKNLLIKGFGGVPNKVDCKPAKHLSTVVHQMVNYIGCLQMEFAGAQAFNSIDTLLAPFVRTDELTYKQVKQNMQQLVFSLNIPSRWGSQFPFSNVTFDWVAPDDMKNEKAIVGGKLQTFTYGDCQKEMDMINRAFIEVLLEGDANGRTFSFPIPTYNLTKNFDWDSENAKLLFEMTAKYGSPYFQNYIGSGLDPSSIRAMCCRLNINQTELINRPGGMWGPGDSSISGDTPVYVNIDGNWELKHIGDIHKEKLENFKTLSFDPLTSDIVEASVSECVKHGIRDVFKLKTNQGTIKITENHCMFNVSDGGDIANATLGEIRKRGYFIAPKSHIVGSMYKLNKRAGRKMSYNIRVFSHKGEIISINRKYGKDIRHLLVLFRSGVAELKKNIPTKKAIELGLPQPFYNMHYTPRENTVIKGFEILKRNNLMNGYFDTVLRFLENYERVDVLGVKYSGKEDVYDLSVPGHENFVAGNGMFFTHNTGSIGVVTINMNRLAYEARKESKDPDEARTLFLNKLRKYMLLGRDSLETKRTVVERNLKNGLMPYTRVYLGTFKNHFSTIGLCGMNEACLNLLGKDIATPEGKALTIETLNFMRDLCLRFQKETNNLYNLEATPAESTSYRFAKLDKEAHPDIITSGSKEPYLTNSTQLPVDHTDDLIEAIEHQNDIQQLYTGGTIFHTFLGEKLSSGEASKNLVKKIAENTKLPYFSITPTFSVCPEHGYIRGEHFRCPKPSGSGPCGKETEVFSRIVGYYRPVKNWNLGKREEFRDRKEFLEQKALAGKFKSEAS